MRKQWTLVTDDGGCISSNGCHDSIESVWADIEAMTTSGYVFTWDGPRRGTVFEPSSGATSIFSIEQHDGPEFPPSASSKPPQWARCTDCGSEVYFDAYVTYDGELVNTFADYVCSGDCNGFGRKSNYEVVDGTPEDQEAREVDAPPPAHGDLETLTAELQPAPPTKGPISYE